MTIYVDGRDIDRHYGVYEDLDDIVTILGTTTLNLWPFLSIGRDTNPQIHSYGSGAADSPELIPRNAAGTLALLDTFQPHQFRSGLCSYKFLASGDYHLESNGDHASFTFGDATLDSPFSVGVWLLMLEAVGSVRSLLAKYRTTVATAREWDFRFSAAGVLELELYDESATATEIGTGTTALTPFIWQHVVATYDGNEEAPDVHLYINGVDTLVAGTTTETGAYVAMEDTATPLLVGARNIQTAPAQEFEGRLALPFLTGTALSAAQVSQLYGIGRRLVDLV